MQNLHTVQQSLGKDKRAAQICYILPRTEQQQQQQGQQPAINARICTHPKAASTNHLTASSAPLRHLSRSLSTQKKNGRKKILRVFLGAVLDIAYDAWHSPACSLSVLEIRRVRCSFRIHDELDFTTAPAINQHRHRHRHTDTDTDTYTAAGDADAVQRDSWVSALSQPVCE